MDNSEEYVLQVFRRAQSMLEGDIKPEHVAYLVKLGQKFALTSDLRTEIVCLNFIQGFSKAGVAFEWLLGRSKRDSEFNLDQFDDDVQVLYDALIDSFNAEGFDPYAFDEKAQPPLATAAPAPTPAPVTKPAAAPEPARIAKPAAPPAPTPEEEVPEPDWFHSAGFAADSVTHVVPSAAAPEVVHTPSLTDLLDNPMLLTVRRLSDSAAMFDQKPLTERATGLAVLKMMAKNIADMSRPQNKVMVTGTFIEVASFLESIERKSVAKDPDIAKAVRELGTMLSFALHDTSNGIKYMQEITEFIHTTKATRLA